MFLRQLKESRAAIPALLKRWNVPRLDYFLPVAFCVTLALGFFFLQKDLGPALVISCLFLTLYAMARGRATGALTGLLLIAGGFLCGYLFGVPHTVSDRIDMFVHPWDNMVHGGNQLAASLWAIAGRRRIR
jgi:cell division protein FtsW (lipid II flippase)